MVKIINMICPECGKKFHACPSCGLPHDYLYEYCSDECYKRSLKYEEKKNHVLNLIRASKSDILKLDDLSDYLQDEAVDEIFLILSEEDIQQEWYRGSYEIKK